jgi:hypothetical protein
MSKAHKDLLASLKSQQSKLEDVARMLPTVPDEIARLSREIKVVISTVDSSAAEIYDISIGVQALRLEVERKLAISRVPGNTSLKFVQGKLEKTFCNGSPRSSHQKDIKMFVLCVRKIPASGCSSALNF